MRDFTEIHALADGELSTAEASALRESIKTDLAAQAELSSIQNLKDFVSHHAQPIRNDEAWRKCVKRLDEIDKASKAEGFVTRYAWALCGVAFIALAYGGILNRGRTATTMQSSDLPFLLSSLGPEKTPTGGQPAAMKRWVDSVLGTARESIDPSRLVIRSSAEGFVNGHRVLELHMRDAEGDLTLLAVSGDVDFGDMATMPDSRYRAGQMGGANSVAWTAAAHSIVLMGNRAHDDLVRVANSVRIQ